MIEILSAQKYNVALKATIHQTGRLGFTQGTANLLNLGDNSHVLLARDSEVEGRMYLSVLPEETPEAYRLLQSGGYYYLNTRVLFDNLSIDYTTQLVIYDLTRDHEADAVMGGVSYRMEPRYLPRKKDGEADDDEAPNP